MTDNASNAGEGTRQGYEELGLPPGLIATLQRLKLDEPTEIQRRLIPPILEGSDCLARATTGAGKTNAYLLPILQRTESGAGPQALVIQPTRAIALQLQRNLQRFAPEQPVRSAVAVGGRRDRDRPDPLEQAPDILIATPRGAADLVRHGAADWAALRILVIDEVDAIIDDRGPKLLQQVHETLTHEHQTVLIAGSLNEHVRELAKELLRDPIEVEVAPGGPRTATAKHNYFAVDPDEKFDVLVTFCKQESPRLAIVLVNTAREGHDLVRRLERVRVSCRWIGARHPRGHSERREQRGRRPSKPHSEVIVAADPVPRRVSTIPASHLVHYELPEDVDVYLHRLEQAARLRKHGDVIMFVGPNQRDLLAEIEGRIEKPIGRLDTPQRPPGHRRGEKPKPDRSADKNKSNPGQSNCDTTGRLDSVLYRDEELESRGVRPIPRTLGSRFRSTRRGKPLRRPGPPR